MKFYLAKLPVLSIIIFYLFCFIAAILYPGSEKEIINFKSDYYSFTHNFLSELGCLKTNNDENNPEIVNTQDESSPQLFSDEEALNTSSEDNKDEVLKEEEEFEIPAFLRNQKF